MPEIPQHELDRLVEYRDQDTSIWRWTKRVLLILAAIIVLFVGISMLLRVVGPQLNLYKANTENQKVISQQRAASDAAVYAAKSTVIQSEALAKAEIERAKGAAQAQAIIADTLTEPYLRYLYIQGLGSSEHEVIYLPTEAGLPILEAGRFHNEEPTP